MRETPFSRLPEEKPDPLFQVGAEARAAGPNAINGTVGMLLDEQGKTGLLPSVHKAIHDLLGRELDFSYPPLNGLPQFQQAVHTLLFGKDKRQAASIATIGGAEAIFLNLRLLRKMNPNMRVVLPDPPWVNHRALCEETGIAVDAVPYLSDGKPSIEQILQACREKSSAVLLQGYCHNPTGLDFNDEQWKELAKDMSDAGSVALLDVAYQGFAGEPESDVLPLRILADAGVPTLVAWSASKNHTIYSERAGLAAAIVPDLETKRVVDSQYACSARSTRSASPSMGQRIVSVVQEEYADDWRQDLRDARFILMAKRKALAEQLPQEFTESLSGNGMFARLPLSESEIRHLKAEQVFLANDGRINIAGIPLKRVPELAEKIRKLKNGSSSTSSV